jgi:site-specific DNA recombinase
MTPSFSKKGEIRYRFYVSSALLNGQKQSAGTLPRISAPDLEAAVITAVRDYISSVKPQADLVRDRDALVALVDRIEVSRDRVRVTAHTSAEIAPDDTSHPAGPSEIPIEPRPERHIDIPWRPGSQALIAQIDNSLASTDEPDPALVQAIARAHSWVNSLTNGEHTTIESLASSVNMNPKVIRKYIRLPFLDPKITEAVLLGRQPKSLTVKALVKSASLSWAEQRNGLAISA